MSGLCYERPGIEFPTRRLAMDAALPDSATTNASKPRIDDDAFKQILEALKDQLDPQNLGKVRDTLAKFTAMAMDEPLPPRRVAPENLERAVALLRAKGVDEPLIAKVCAAVGASVPDAQAMDAAIRSRSYAARFPEAERLGNAALAFDRSTNSYARMFPEAARLS